MTAQQSFKAAYAVARTLRSSAAGQAEFSFEHGRHFVTERFCSEVRIAVGFNPSTGSPEMFRAANAAALIVATDVLCSRAQPASLSDRLAQRKAADEYVYDFN